MDSFVSRSERGVVEYKIFQTVPEDRRVAAEKLEAHLFGPKLDPSFSGRRNAPPGFVGAEEVIGRGARI